MIRAILALAVAAAVLATSPAPLADGASPWREAFSATTAGPGAGPAAGPHAEQPRDAHAEAIVDEAVREVTDAFGPIPVPYRVSLLADDRFDTVARYWFPERFRQVDGLSLITDGEVNHVYIRGSQPTAAITLKHELFHLIWCARVDCHAMPLWLIEGAAIAFSEGYAGTGAPPPPAAPPWWNLPQRGFRGTRHPGNPHAVGRQVMAHLARTVGPDAVAAFLTLVVKEGMGYEEAWRRAFGFPLSEIGQNI